VGVGRRLVERSQDGTQPGTPAGAQPGQGVIGVRRRRRVDQVQLEQQGRPVTRHRAHAFHPKAGRASLAAPEAGNLS